MGFDDLFLVGTAKPLGYLPISTIQDRGKSPIEIREWAMRAGLGSRELSMLECTIGSGAVFVWHDEALQSLLNDNVDILRRANWPTLAEDFVLYVANKHAHEPDLFELVGVAFNCPTMQKPRFVRRRGKPNHMTSPPMPSQGERGDDLPIEIVSDLAGDLHQRVYDQIKLKIEIVDSAKDKFRVSLGALSASIGAVAGIFSAAYKLPMKAELGYAISIALLELGEKAKTMTDAEWAALALKARQATGGIEDDGRD